MDRKLYLHAVRLKSDYTLMLSLKGSVIDWKALSELDADSNIYPDVYEVTFHILAPTTGGNANIHTIKIDCSSPSYPVSAPYVKFVTSPVKHPHVFNDGRVCLGKWRIAEQLASLCVRIARFIQFDQDIFDEESIASPEFNGWYQANISLFPMDRSPLPSVGEDTPMKLGEQRAHTSTSSFSLPEGQHPKEEPGYFRINRRTDRNP